MLERLEINKPYLAADKLFDSKLLRESLKPILTRLSISAPALQSLQIECSGANITDHITLQHPLELLPLIGLLSQLKSLTLLCWTFSREELPPVSHLSNLHDLKVIYWI